MIQKWNGSVALLQPIIPERNKKLKFEHCKFNRKFYQKTNSDPEKQLTAFSLSRLKTLALFAP